LDRLKKKVRGAGGLKRLPCSSFLVLERATKLHKTAFHGSFSKARAGLSFKPTTAIFFCEVVFTDAWRGGGMFPFRSVQLLIHDEGSGGLTMALGRTGIVLGSSSKIPPRSVKTVLGFDAGFSGIN
jgi:hypothetical protein